MREYLFRVLVAIDQLLGTLVGIPDADLTISGWVGYKYPNTWMERSIDTLFFWIAGERQHCLKSIEWDVIARMKK